MGNYDNAESIAENILQRKNIKAYDRAKTYEMLTSIYLAKEQYKKSSGAAEKALELGSVISMHHKLFYLYFYLEDYVVALEHFEYWLKLETSPDIQSYFTAAQVYALSENMEKALSMAMQGMNVLALKPAFEPKESWYQLLISIQLKARKYAEASESLELAITRWPRRLDYYVQLSAVYQKLGQEKESLVMLSMAYQYNLIKSESDISRLVQLFRYHAYPSRGAEILFFEISNKLVKRTEKNWVILSDAWIQSRNWSKVNDSLLKAADLSDTGIHWFSLCQTSFQEESWGNAQNYCRKALNKGEIGKKEGSAWYLLALSQYYEQKLTLASKSFEQCAEWAATQEDCKN